jgi:hypothetical protein
MPGIESNMTSMMVIERVYFLGIDVDPTTVPYGDTKKCPKCKI